MQDRPSTPMPWRLPSAEFGPARLEWPGGSVDIARLRLRDAALAWPGDGSLPSGTAAELELSTLSLQAHLPLPEAPAEVQQAVASAGRAERWRLEPLEHLDGAVHAVITDAALLFDARVTVPVSAGEVDFNQASVEHIGPDSRMGISRMGLYVDAPGGRTYLLQFATPPQAGVRYEQRSALLGHWTTDRGQLSLRPFLEAMLAQMARSGPRAAGGFTAQARTLFARTAMRGELRPGDGVIDLGPLQLRLVGRAEGRNTALLDSAAVGRGLSLSLDDVALADLRLRVGERELRAGRGSARLRLRVQVRDDGLAIELSLGTLILRDVQLGAPTDATPPTADAAGSA